MRSFGERGSFWTAAAVAGLALWASGAPSVAYPLYVQQWHLSLATTTAIFAVYPIALIPVLLIFGNLSDVIGRRATMLIGIALLAVGAAAFAVAPSLAWVFVGRVLMGFGVGLSLSPATAAMIELGGPTRAPRASSTTTAATATGLALATLIGGALVEYAPAPTHLPFVVLFVVTLVVLVAVLFLPRQGGTDKVAWRPRAPRIPAGIRRPFTAGTLAVAAAYASGAVFLALGAQIARDLVRSQNALVDGSVISVSAVTIGAVAIFARRLAPTVGLPLGAVATTAGFGLLIMAAQLHALVPFLAAAVVSGAGYSLLFSGGLGLLTRNAPSHHRGAVMSAAYTGAYLVQAVAALGLGAIATAQGLDRALEIGSPLIIAVAVLAVIISRPSRSRRVAAISPSA